jgi:hypothetical protein
MKTFTIMCMKLQQIHHLILRPILPPSMSVFYSFCQAFRLPAMVLACLASLAPQALQAARLSGKGLVKIEKQGSKFVLTRDGEPYYVKGIGGQKMMDVAADLGANSTRTWGTEKASSILDDAEKLGMTATIGVWLDQNAARYRDENYKARMRKEIESLVKKIKKHPALLCYALGNETNAHADTPEAWTFINELAEYIHKEDPDHPVMTVLAGSSSKTLNNVAQYAPAIDLVGVNTYRGIVNAPRDVEASNFKGPYLITEWGPYGHWEVGKTSWGAALEQNSEEKAAAYQSSYELILQHGERCLGSYVFLWGQKQERTPTWYGMFLEENSKLGLKGETVASVDIMSRMWTGKNPANRAPAVKDFEANGKTASQSLSVKPDESFTAELQAQDPDGDSLTYIWEVLPEATQLGSGGSFEPRPSPVDNAVKSDGQTGKATITVGQPGNYRIFAYALDGKGKAGTANIPFQVR